MKANETLLADAMQKCLPPAEYVEFLDNLQEVLDAGLPYSDSDHVVSAFSWFDAPQGEDYWSKCYEIQEGYRRD